MEETAYNPQKIEKKWQEYWKKNNSFQADDTEKTKKKMYVLDMFPYPSGSGLHVGHPEGYTATDIMSRYYRMNGMNVLHPMGWDAFGLPAENYAIKTKIHPQKSTRDNIKTFTNQIQSLGFSYDWSREISTCESDYYKWTQWFFLFLYEKGLAYRKEAPVNWCESCKTVLANEQVGDGTCDRCHGPIIQRNLTQWFFKITEFIEDYTDAKTKRTTHGLLSGLENIDWPQSTKIAQANWIGKKEGVIIHHKVIDSDIVLDSFSAFPAWLFADSYIVIAPEHPLVAELVKGSSYEAEVKKFVEDARKITSEERNADKFEKKGVFTGRYAINPFAEHEPTAPKKMPIYLANFALMGFGTGIIRCSSHDARDLAFAKKYDIELREVVERTDPNTPIDAHPNKGTLIKSGPFTGKDISPKLIEDIKDFVVEEKLGAREVTYRLRDWLVSRQRYWGAPIPVVHCKQCGEVPLTLKDLPIELPHDVDFNPTGESPLTQSKSFHDVTCPKCGTSGPSVRREVDTMDTFVCSSWYFLRFMDARNDTEFASKAMMKKWGPVDLYVGGAEHTVLHLLYSRFFTKALHKYGYIDFDEPFLKLRHQGLILGEDGEKMSKSRGNVVNPTEIVEKFGADSLRMYEMFMGPFKDSKPWSTNGVIGIYRFLQKVWKLCVENKVGTGNESLRHQTIKKVTEYTEDFKFNTAVSQLMIYVNSLTSAGASKEDLETLTLLLSPYAPHIAHELWSNVLKKKSDLSATPWPTYHPELCVEAEIELAVQVNGKLRATFKVHKDISASEAIAQAKSLENVTKYLTGEIVKEIFVPGKLVNIVVKS